MSRRGQILDLNGISGDAPAAAFHQWYDFVLGYPHHLVKELLGTLSVERGQMVVDPFCGAGTTSIECAKHRVSSIGIDANPFAVFAATTKSSFRLDPSAVQRAADRVEDRYARLTANGEDYTSDITYLYLDGSGMLERGWISPKPLRSALTLRKAIRQCRDPEIRNVLMLALVADLPAKIGNMKYGPQIYRGPAKLDVDPLPFFRARVALIVADLSMSSDRFDFANVTVSQGDTRACVSLFKRRVPFIDYIICSPPYPTEHDYTRHMRLELAFMDSVSTLACLRAIKRTMIRSHSKGVYKDDNDASFSVSNNVELLARQVATAVADKASKFEKLYPTVVRSYFGGMHRHFASIFPFLKPGAKAAYIVGNQAAYARIPVHTAALLGEIAEQVGFRVREVKLWRRRWATGLSGFLDENILLLEKPSLPAVPPRAFEVTAA